MLNAAYQQMFKQNLIGEKIHIPDIVCLAEEVLLK